MRLGLISDIHADHSALLRALDLLEQYGAEKIVCAGDIVEKGPDGDRVVSTLQESLAICVRGNHDDNAIRRFHEGDQDHDDPLLQADTIAFLEALPQERFCCWDGVRILISHIAPEGGSEPVLPEYIPKRLKRTLRDAELDVLILGHTHRPMQLRWGELLLLNPGSVARSRARDSATCALLDLPSMAFTVLSLHSGSPIAPGGTGG